MIEAIAVFILGAISVAIPFVIWYLRALMTTYVIECQKSRDGLDETLKDLNQLHNNALATHKTLEARIIKLETTNAVQNYGVSKR